MPIRTQDLDPIIARAVKEWMAQVVATQSAAAPGASRVRMAGIRQWRESLRRNAYHFWGAGACFGAGIAAIPLLAHHGPGVAMSAFMGIQASAVALVVRGHLRSNRQLTEHADVEVLRNAGELLELTPAERLYCSGVASLIEAEEALSEVTRSEILAQLNELLASYRKLDGPVRQHLAARGNQPIEGLESELAELVRRRDLASDSTARATMDQSIMLCSQRLADARALAPAREQAEAQQELILQALASVHASLSRMAAADSAAVQTRMGELQRTVSRVNEETRAVEDAVNEVLTLRG